MTYPLNKKFVFIIGHHRSGTSLFHRIIRDHPSISGFKKTNVRRDEGQHLQNLFEPDSSYGGPGKYIFNKSSYMNERNILANDVVAGKLFNQWSKYWDISKDFLLEKSPPTIVRTRFMQKLFPNSFFIKLFRNPLAVSYATRKWSKTDITSLLDHTLLGYEILDKDTFHLKNHYSLKYEDFVSNPEIEINKIFNFLGLPKSKIHYEVKTGINEKYFEEWAKDSEGKNIMSNKLIKNFEDRMSTFGYSLFDRK